MLIETESIATVSEVKLANGKVKQVPAAWKNLGESRLISYYLPLLAEIFLAA